MEIGASGPYRVEPQSSSCFAYCFITSPFWYFACELHVAGKEPCYKAVTTLQQYMAC